MLSIKRPPPTAPSASLFSSRLLSNGRDVQNDTPANLSPTDQPPVLVDPAREGNLLLHLGADGTLKDNLGHVRLDADDSRSRCRRADVDEQDLTCGAETKTGVSIP